MELGVLNEINVTTTVTGEELIEGLLSLGNQQLIKIILTVESRVDDLEFTNQLIKKLQKVIDANTP